ncbi:Translation initiation factor eIF-2B subunit beta [Monocercomonoides exilis]|uniref:Translation initiation factor eIF-2B subunit beta n=1 Tax=Monocercomonoides exilis TaxID=2049356 RepID=UPI003559A3B6|nr:Translation initiation factor eIF-2B subunit beta [Monocercomonoides exilis]|eukprot:MONOS_5317.1-p1 / transcript=MONOS_5317.1 / gene=MONOS_5317 / organism=Monocercomonoides_exilis_PA203 / gene_product=Translation initiation factor eIF-2B subunit beta / transcript_product=Translation initiation factor eIF-2B subunit beta / location=Mono_scaffold00153:49095-51848(-) / protein_length=572 / sequence_SO=supercontig / SO=protein_coding / is_pseudo=false
MDEEFEFKRKAVVSFLDVVQSQSGSLPVANATLDLCSSVVRTNKTKGTAEMIKSLRAISSLILQFRHSDFVINNMILKALHIIRGHSSSGPENEKESQHKTRTIIQEIKETKKQLEDYYEQILLQASDYIQNDSVILTAGFSETVYNFLINAHKGRHFSVFVTNGAPSFHGHKMANELAKAGVQTFLIPDAAAVAVMGRVNKVIVGTTAITADGGLLTDPGISSIALAAKERSLPFIVLAGLYKLTPIYVSSPASFNEQMCPSGIMDIDVSAECGDPPIINPRFDYVPPQHVSLIITNNDSGACAPVSVPHLLKELYSPEDYTPSDDPETSPTTPLPAASPTPAISPFPSFPSSPTHLLYSSPSQSSFSLAPHPSTLSPSVTLPALPQHIPSNLSSPSPSFSSSSSSSSLSSSSSSSSSPSSSSFSTTVIAVPVSSLTIPPVATPLPSPTSSTASLLSASPSPHSSANSLSPPPKIPVFGSDPSSPARSSMNVNSNSASPSLPASTRTTQKKPVYLPSPDYIINDDTSADPNNSFSPTDCTETPTPTPSPTPSPPKEQDVVSSFSLVSKSP